MTEPTWTAVDNYFSDLLVPQDAALDAALADSAAAGLPAIHVSRTQGKFLQLLAKMHGSRRILEIGTLGGYSTIWLARALPADGKMITLEFSPRHAAVARENIVRAGLGDVVDVRLGPALETLPKLKSENAGPFDFIFIDADKPSNADYFNWAVQLSRVGSVIVVDNVVRSGNVANAASSDENVQGVRRFVEAVSREKRVQTTAIQTVGSKGYDGFAISLVVS